MRRSLYLLLLLLLLDLALTSALDTTRRRFRDKGLVAERARLEATQQDPFAVVDNDEEVTEQPRTLHELWKTVPPPPKMRPPPGAANQKPSATVT